MKPDYRITFAISALLIVGALILPPWKNSFTGQFSGFHYVFSNADLVKFLELDYPRLTILIIGIILIVVTGHLLLLALNVTPFFNKSQSCIEKVQSTIRKQTNSITENYLIIKAIILLLLSVMLLVLDK